MKIVFFGSDNFVVPVLEKLIANFEVTVVVTAPNSPIFHFAKQKIPVLTPTKLDPEFVTTNHQLLTSDLFIVASYGKIIPQSLLNIPKFGALNIHPSLLPKYRGPSPVPETILQGDSKTGVTIIKMDEKMDHGPIITTKETSLSGKENLTELINKLFQIGADLIVEIIPDFLAGKIKVTEQDHEKAIFCKLITKDDGYFDINNPPEKLDRMIRAYYPWPGVWCKWNGKIVKLVPAKAGTHDKFLIQMEGKKAITFKDFQNGYPDFPLTLNSRSLS